MSAPLEPEIRDALRKAGLRARSVTGISTIRSPAIDRAAYRIDAGDRLVKARRLESVSVARRLCELRHELPRAFAPVIFRHGRVLLEEWIDGEPLPLRPGPRLLEEAAALLAALHGRRTLGRRVLHRARSSRAHVAAAENGLRAAAAAGALGAREAALLARALRRFDPRTARQGLVHFDFAGENMIVDREGMLRVVDNERVTIDALGFDLGRAWYRWSLPAAGWSRFCAAYAANASWSEPLASLRFWRIVAAARAAALRLHACPEQSAAPLGRLRALASELSR